jgi:hypothetical protein
MPNKEGRLIHMINNYISGLPYYENGPKSDGNRALMRIALIALTTWIPISGEYRLKLHRGKQGAARIHAPLLSEHFFGLPSYDFVCLQIITIFRVYPRCVNP